MGDPLTGRAAALAPLREHNFRWYFSSRSVNLLGNVMAPIALAFAVLDVSGSPSSLGAVLAAHSIPMVVFLLAGGVIADRYGRALVIQTSNLLSGLSQALLAGLVISGHAQLWQMIVLSAVNGMVSAASLPAMAGIVPQLVPREQLQPANVLLSLTRGSLAVLGPSTAAAIVVTVGPGWALAVDATTWLVAAALLVPVEIPAREPTEPASMLTEIRQGWHLVVRTRWLWVVMLAFTVLNATHEGGLNILGPTFAKGTSIGEHGWGLAMSAIALGMLSMTVVLLRVEIQRPLLTGMLGCACFGLPMLSMGLWSSTLPLLVASYVAGMGIELFSLGWSLALQEHIPGEMLSRVYSFDALGSFIAIPIGQLSIGPLAEAFGIQRVLLVAGLAYMGIALLTLTSSSVRGLSRDPASTTVQA